jgi:exodeoxyribonuclease-3
MALRAAKADRLAALKADVAVIAECSRVDALALSDRHHLSTVWADGRAGDGREDKGLAVFAKPGIRLTLAEVYDPDLKVVIPIEVRGDQEFNLLAVWAKRPYASTIHRALVHYEAFLRSVPSLVMGDFNTNAIWDGRRPINHSVLDTKLKQLGLVSAYHAFFDERQGDESRATHHFYRKLERPFHIDYCYLPEAWLPNLSDVSVGGFDTWSGLSDHVPLVVSLTVSAYAPEHLMTLPRRVAEALPPA